MKPHFPDPQHASFLAHRKQVVWQVILPILLAAVLLTGFVVLISLATFEGEGDASRWAAISTIWIVLPLVILGLIGLLVLAGIIFLIARLLKILPAYTGIAQDYAYRLEAITKRATGTAVKPVFLFSQTGAFLKALFGRK